MKEQSTQPKSLRHRGILLIESVAVFLALLVTLAYVNDSSAPDVPDNKDNNIVELQATVDQQATQIAEVPTIHPDVVKMMAWQEASRGHYQAAIAQYNLVIAANPNDMQALLERGIVYARSGDHERAIEDYTAAARLQRSNALVYYNRGISYDALGMTDLALHDYDHSIRHDPYYAYTWNNRGYVYASLGNWSQAINDYTQAISLDPTYATAYNNRAIAYSNLGQLDNSLKDYQKALELDPMYVDANYNYGILMYKQGDYQEALNAFHIVIKSNFEKTPQMWNNHGSAFHRLGQYSHAIQSYSEALNLDPNYDLARRNRASAYTDLGDYQSAVADYDWLIMSNPYDYQLYVSRGNALEKIEPASANAAVNYLKYLRRGGVVPRSMQEVSEHEYSKEFKIGRNEFHQFYVFVREGDSLDFSVISNGVDRVDPMIVILQSDDRLIKGNDDTDQTFNAALFDVHFEQTGWVSVYVGLAGGGADYGQVLFSMQPSQ